MARRRFRANSQTPCDFRAVLLERHTYVTGRGFTRFLFRSNRGGRSRSGDGGAKKKCCDCLLVGVVVGAIGNKNNKEQNATAMKLCFRSPPTCSNAPRLVGYRCSSLAKFAKASEAAHSNGHKQHGQQPEQTRVSAKDKELQYCTGHTDQQSSAAIHTFTVFHNWLYFGMDVGA